jgi:hypothetical protein
MTNATPAECTESEQIDILLAAAVAGRRAAAAVCTTLGPERSLLLAMTGPLTRALDAAGLDACDEQVWDCAAASFLLALVREPDARKAAILVALLPESELGV